MKFILPCSWLSRSPPRNSFIISGFFLFHASPENNKNIKILNPELLNKFGNGTKYWVVVQWTLGKTEIRWTNLSDQTKQLENILRYDHASKKIKNKNWWLKQLTHSLPLNPTILPTGQVHTFLYQYFAALYTKNCNLCN